RAVGAAELLQRRGVVRVSRPLGTEAVASRGEPDPRIHVGGVGARRGARAAEGAGPDVGAYVGGAVAGARRDGTAEEERHGPAGRDRGPVADDRRGVVDGGAGRDRTR